MESRQKAVETDLADPDILRIRTKSVPLLAEYKALREKLDASFLEWEAFHEELEKIQNSLEE